MLNIEISFFNNIENKVENCQQNNFELKFFLEF